MPHKSAFHTEYGDTVLFQSWVLYSKKETFFSALMLVVLGITYQGLKSLRHRLGRKCPNVNCRRYMLNTAHLIQTLLYIMQFLGGYVLMLAVMTYNVWLLVGGVLGLGLGYFFFGWMEMDNMGLAYFPPRNNCGLVDTLDCGFHSKEQELQPLSAADGGGAAGDGSIACKCNETLITRM